MRRLLFALILSLPASLWAAEPKVVVRGPHAAVAGTLLFLDVSDSISDPETPLVVGVAEADKGTKPAVKLIKDEGIASIARVLPSEPGVYQLVFAATGKKDEKSGPVTVYWVWPLTVTKVPGPTPDPGPEPTPDPRPAPVVGKLWGVLVVPDFSTPSQASLRTSPKIRAAFGAIPGTYFPSYLASEREIQALSYSPALAAAGGPPAVLWLDESGKVVRTTAGATEAKILADLKSLRGN